MTVLYKPDQIVGTHYWLFSISVGMHVASCFHAINPSPVVCDRNQNP